MISGILNNFCFKRLFHFSTHLSFHRIDGLRPRFFSESKTKTNVTFSPQVLKVLQEPRKVPQRTLASFYALFREIAAQGPYRSQWPNYGKLSNNVYHCHLSKAFDWVAVWSVRPSQDVEFIYLGTRQNAKSYKNIIEKSSLSPRPRVAAS